MTSKSLIAILLASLILIYIGHGVIPHHHHMDAAQSEKECRQHDSGDHDGYADNAPNHCHAFNGLHYVISAVNSSGPRPAESITLNNAEITPPVDKPLVSMFSEHRNMGSLILCPGFLGQDSGLRAPPAA